MDYNIGLMYKYLLTGGKIEKIIINERPIIRRYGQNYMIVYSSCTTVNGSIKHLNCCLSFTIKLPKNCKVFLPTVKGKITRKLYHLADFIKDLGKNMTKKIIYTAVKEIKQFLTDLYLSNYVIFMRIFSAF